jgi:flagellar basal-body rod modification protein FlgD
MYTTGIENQLAALHDHRTLKPMASSGASGSSTDDSASISANDFLTLLVTEMQNQDPTANTDPNEYINQLVQVNSLEQLISINQTLQADSPAGNAVSSPGKQGIPASPIKPGTGAQLLSSQPADLQAATIQPAPGNLAVPQTKDAALRVAQSLVAP